MSKVLIIAPHVDDEVLSCGGLMAKLKKTNIKPHVAFCVIDPHKQYGEVTNVVTDDRIFELEAASKFMNYNYEILWKDRDYHLKLDFIPIETLIIAFEDLIQKHKPEWLFIPWYSNYNQDHTAISEALYTALRPMSTEFRHFVPNVLYYDEASHNAIETQHIFVPNYILPLTEEEMNMKLEAVALHKTQLRESPNLRSLEVLKSIMKLRGAQIATDWGEGYKVMRMVGDINVI